MNILAIMMRELRVLSRRRSSWTVRTLFTAAILSTWALCRDFTPAGDLIALSIVAMSLFGPGAAIASSDVISSERRNRTLGLLLLTPLRSPEVIFGKLAACISQYLLFLAAVLPVFALPLLGGGVEGAAVIRQILGLLAASLLGMSIGLAASVLCRRAVASATLSFSAVLLLFLAPLFAAQFIDDFPGVLVVPSPSGALPLFAARFIDDFPSLRNVDFFWMGPLFLPLHEFGGAHPRFGSWPLNLAIVLGLALGFLLAAAVLFSLIWRWERRAVGAERRRPDPREGPSRPIGDGENPLRALRCPVGLVHPVFTAHLLLAFAGSVLLMFAAGDYWEGYLAFSYLAGAVLLAAAYWRISLEAPSPIGRLQRSGMLELVSTTPVPRPSLHAGLALLARAPLRWNGFLILCVNFALLMALLFNEKSVVEYLIPLHLGALVLLPLDLASLRAAGTWLGLRSGSTLKAATILFLSHVVAPAILLPIALIAAEDAGMRSPFPVVSAWFLCRALFHAAVLLWCRGRARRWIVRGSAPAG